MKKNKDDLLNRSLFIQMCIEQPSDGVAYLDKMANKIKNSKSTTERITIIKSLLFISERTIFRDIRS